MSLIQLHLFTNLSPPLISHNKNIGSEVPLFCCDSFPPGEAKSGSQKLVPSIGRLNFVSFGQMLSALQNLILNFPIHERSFLWTH